MNTRSMITAGMVALFTMPLSAHAQGIGEGARQGARTGYGMAISGPYRSSNRSIRYWPRLPLRTVWRG
jgi:hypothetical protein